MGRRSVVFEAQPIPGGMLALGIPEYRLPKTILEAGHRVHPAPRRRAAHRHAGHKRSGRSAQGGFKAVFLATGAQKAAAAGHRGREARRRPGQPGIPPRPRARPDAVLRQERRRDRRRQRRRGRGAHRRCGSAREKVMILYRRTREEMPAYEEEVEEALNEGVELQELVAPKRDPRRERQGGRHRDGADAAGRCGRHAAAAGPCPIEGSEFMIECDMVLPAIGQVPSTEPAGGHRLTAGEDRPRGHGHAGRLPLSGVFAGGDVVSGGGTRRSRRLPTASAPPWRLTGTSAGRARCRPR